MFPSLTNSIALATFCPELLSRFCVRFCISWNLLYRQAGTQTGLRFHESELCFKSDNGESHTFTQQRRVLLPHKQLCRLQRTAVFHVMLYTLTIQGFIITQITIRRHLLSEILIKRSINFAFSRSQIKRYNQFTNKNNTHSLDSFTTSLFTSPLIKRGRSHNLHWHWSQDEHTC